MNIDRCEFTQVIEMDPRSRIDKPTSGRDHKYAGVSGRGPRERSRVCDLAAKIEPAEKGEHLRDRRAAFAAQFPRRVRIPPCRSASCALVLHRRKRVREEKCGTASRFPISI